MQTKDTRRVVAELAVPTDWSDSDTAMWLDLATREETGPDAPTWDADSTVWSNAEDFNHDRQPVTEAVKVKFDGVYRWAGVTITSGTTTVREWERVDKHQEPYLVNRRITDDTIASATHDAILEARRRAHLILSAVNSTKETP